MPAEGSKERIAASRVLLVGLGGLGCPAALALAGAGVGRLLLCDDDIVDEGNLHRQILYQTEDVGQDKLVAAERSLRSVAVASGTELELVRSRFLPDNARALVRQADVVVEGSDNFATKFLMADACHLEQRPIVHGAGLRWSGTAWSVAPRGRPCYRCLFEELPAGPQANCDGAGVMGPVVGFIGALLAEFALRVLSGAGVRTGLWTFEGKADTLREVPVAARDACVLCGSAPSIREIDEARYLSRDGTRAAPRAPRTADKETDMAVTVRIPTPLRSLTKGEEQVSADGATVRAVINHLEQKHPGLKERLLDDKGIRRFVNLYLGDEDVRFLQGLDTPLKAGDELSIIPAIAGG